MNVELFGGCGGLALGFRRAGLGFDLTVDRGRDACDSYEANVGRRPLQVDVRELVELARRGWSPGDVRLLVADPPCSGAA